MKQVVFLDPTTTAGGYFLSSPRFTDGVLMAGINSTPYLHCTTVDWDKPPGFVRLVQAPDEQKNRSETVWTLPSKCIALVTPWVDSPAKDQTPAPQAVRH